ncbi:MAG: chromosomal replication initiator protein DnaA [Candidatus Palauibacterales bacterium]|nr:chromosomal replication initiator protein DnaA [Candidatus Palauibacterales bacterium]
MELTADELWSRISDAARDVLPEQTFRTWLSSAEAVTLADDGGTLVVGAPTKFAVEWIEDKYGSLLAELAEKEAGRAVTLTFEHRGDGDGAMEFPEIGGENGDGNPATATEAPEAPAEETDAGEVGLNERYTFERFVIGSNNQLAAAACQRVADAPAQAYNPLFIYGDTGLGKTHLMHAIGHAILEREPDRRVAYIPSERFTNEMIAAIQSGRTAQFRQRYRQIDVLLVDDVHFLGNKEGTQEEFFHTFNSLYDAHKQIVITSDRAPQEIPGLQERLVSRFEWGLVTDIKPPDFETRVAILQKKAVEDNLTIDDSVITYIARNRKTSVRQLEGALIKLLAYSSLTRREINLELAREALGQDEEEEEEETLPSAEEIRERTAERWDVSVEGLTSKRRTRNLTVPRQVAMYLIKNLLDLPYTKIGELFGDRDHSTVIHSVNKVEAEMASDAEFRNRVRSLHEELSG